MRSVPVVVVLIALLACGGDGNRSTEPPPSGPAVASIAVSAPSGSIETGTSVTLVAIVRDQTGGAITNRSLTWSSSNITVATVTSSGVVTGVGAGAAFISAAVDGKSGSAQVVVIATPVATVSIVAPPSPVIAGVTSPLAVIVNDRNGSALVGRRVTWVSSSPLVATVDANGKLSALSPGTTTVTATCEGVSASLAIVVSAPQGSTPPVITSISPAALIPGTAATIDGANFIAGGGNTVTLAGQLVSVTSATPTQLRVIIPAAGLPCQSTQAVPVTVSTVGGIASAKQPLETAKTRAMSVGDSFILGASDAILCNELPAGGSYLISIFNGGPSSTTTTRFDFRGSAGGITSARVPTMELPLAALNPLSDPVSRVAADKGRRHLEHLENDLALFERLGAPRRTNRGPAYSRAVQPPVPLTVGATTAMNFHYASCGTAGMTTVTARVVYVGSTSIVLEDVTSAFAGKIDADLIALAREFESVSFPLLLNFGNPLAYDAQTDANGRIVMLFTPKVNDQGQNLLGFVAGCDLYPASQDPSVAASNQAEVFYARSVTDTSSTSTTLDGRAQWLRQMPATMIHEAKHITAYAERLSRSATVFEQVWLEEATAQVASELYGRAIHGNSWRSDATYNPTLWCESRPTTPSCVGGIIAMGNHFAFLTDYLQNFENKSILSGTDDSDIYGSSWLFVRWALDTYGGTSEAAFLRSLVQTSSRSGTPNMEAVTGKPFAQLLAEFTLMLASDNEPGTSAPFSEPSWNLPDVFAGYAELGTRPTAPLAMRTSATGQFTITSRNLRGGGAVLVRVGTSMSGATQLFELRSTSTAPLSPTSTVGMAVLRVQ
jgi:uncharacterized protein YjdB